MAEFHTIMDQLAGVGFYLVTFGALFVLYFADRVHTVTVRRSQVVVAVLCVVLGEAMLFPWSDPEYWQHILFIVVVNEVLRVSKVGERLRHLSKKSSASALAKPDASATNDEKLEFEELTLWGIIARALWHWFFPER